MENSNSLLSDILKKLQEALDEYNCKSETHVTDKEALLSGKFSYYKDRYTIMIHIKDQAYNPLPDGAGKHLKEDAEILKFIPSLEHQFQNAQKSNCSQEEQTALRTKFMTLAEEAGREFLAKMNK